MSTRAEAAPEVDPQLAERFALKALVEACLVVEEGVAGVREVDVAMMLGTGQVPGPFARADLRGLDEVLEALERARREWSSHFAPPLLLRRLVAQGRLGVKTGQGFFPYPRPDDGFAQAKVKLETRAPLALVWLDNPPANSLSPEVVRELEAVWAQVEGDPALRVMILLSPNPALFCAGADIKAFSRMDVAAGGRELIDDMHALVRSWERSRVMTIAAVNGVAYGGGCELVMACDVRLAAFSASFAQPEVDLGIMPGFGGTQRLPRLVGPAKALEMNTTGEPISAEDAYEHGLVNRVAADHELFDLALRWGRKLAGQAPLAIEEIKRVSHHANLDEGLEAEREGFVRVFRSDDAREGIGAFLDKRTPRFRGT